MAASGSESGENTTLGTPFQEGRSVARATGVLGGLTVASRLLGLARDIAQAAILGTGMAADAFTLAFIIPNILRRLFGESTVSAAFVPSYTETLVRDNPDAAHRLARRTLTFTWSVLLVIVLLGMLMAPLLVKVFAPGFSAIPGKAELAAGLLRLLFPYILFVGTAAVCMGVLNSHRHFAAPALAPVFFNIAALAGLFVLAKYWRSDAPVWGFSAGILAGGLLQLVVQLPFMKARGVSLKPDFHFGDPALRRVLKLAFPALIGLLAAEINIMVDQLLASLLAPGSVAALAYGQRVTQVPQGIFAVALATALLPTLSRQTALGRLDDAGKTLGFSTLALFGVMIPASLFMVIMAEPIVLTVFARGAFSLRSVAMTAASLRYYSLGMVFFSAVRITATVFYSLKDTRTPVRASVICMALNVVLNGLFTLFFLRTGWAEPLAGLALASSAASLVNFLLLRRWLRGKIGPTTVPARGWIALTASGTAAAALLIVMRGPVDEVSAMGALQGTIALLAGGALVCAVSIGVFILFGGREVRATLARFTRRAR
ncbi:MAG: murein biosynthesis integral membrane protein MurJ [Candidatus Fermentibacteraceae bacterium]